MTFLETLSCIVGYVAPYSTSDADSLYSGVTFGYNNLNRPSATVAVSVYFQLLSIHSLDTNTQEFSVTGLFNSEWTDSRLSWVSASNGNIEEMFFDQTTCWTPKIMVENSFTTVKYLEDDSDIYRVDSNGQVSLSLTGVYTVFCSVDVTYFPYDVQTCHISIRSVYDNAVVTLSYNTGNNTQEIQENNSWDLIDSYYIENNTTVSSKTYSNIKFYFKLKRYPSSFVMYVIMPFILASLTGVFIFLIPTGRDETIGFGATLLLAKCVLLVVFSENIPTSSTTTPLLATYILIMLVLSVLEILISVIIQNFHCNKDNDIPLTGASRIIALICSSVTCQRHRGRRYDTTSRLDSRLDSNETPDLKVTLKRKPSMVTPDNSLNRPNGELKRARTEHAWQRKAICSGHDKIFTMTDLIGSVNRLCFVLFTVFWLVTTIVMMVILSSSAN